MDLTHFLPFSLIVSAFLCTLVAGFLFAFTVVVMPGIKNLNDAAFIRAFQVMDGIIQNNQWLFILVWVGSAVMLLLTGGLGLFALSGLEQTILILSAILYIAGVQLPTIIINIPLNNQLQTVKTDVLSENELHEARLAFEGRWNQWNRSRTLVASVVSFLLIILVFLI